MPTHRVRRRPITRSDGDEYEPGDEIEPTDAELKAFGDNLVLIDDETDADAGDSDPDGDEEAFVDDGLADVLDGTVDEVADALATGEYDAVLDDLVALEEDGEDRKGVLAALDDRREAGGE